MSIHTPESWLAAATLEYGTYWLDVPPRTDHLLEVPAGEPHRVYGVRCNSDEDGDISLIVSGSGEGSAHASRFGDGEGDAHATRSGSGEGDADSFRSGPGAGDADAFRSGSGAGDADTYRSGSGEGNVSADRYGDGSGNSTAHQDGSGEGSVTETDSRGTRRSVDHSGIRYCCLSGDGYLRVGCEIHTLSDWISDAEEIDKKHGDGIAELTKALAISLMNKQE